MTAVFLAGLVVAGRRCVVFGEDLDASARARELAAAGAQVIVVAERAVADLEARSTSGEIRWVRRAPDAADADGAFLAVSTIRDDDSWSAALYARAIAPGVSFTAPVKAPFFHPSKSAICRSSGTVARSMVSNRDSCRSDCA